MKSSQNAPARSWSFLFIWIGPLLFLVLFYFYPLGSILRLSFQQQPGGIVSPIWAALTSPSHLRVVGFTFFQAGLSTLLTLLIGLPGAYLLARFQFRGKSILRALTGIPFVLPTLVVAAAFNALLGPRGWINEGLMTLLNLETAPITFTQSLSAIITAHVFYNTTIVLRMVGDFWAHLDPRIQQAARVLGAGPLVTARQIVLPLLRPAILSAALLVFIFDFTSFGVILLLGGPQHTTLEVEIFYQTVSLFNLPTAAALSLLQLLCTLGLTLLYTRWAARLSTPLGRKPVRYTERKLYRLRSRVIAGLLIAFLILLLVTPLVALATRSITRFTLERGERGEVQRGLTLDYYRELSQNRRDSIFYVPPQTAIGISLGYAILTMGFAITIGLPAAWALSKGEQHAANAVLDPILMLPLGTSAVTLGLGFIVALGQPPLELRASPLLIPLAHSLVAFPFVVRSLTPALRSIHPRLRQAAEVLGADPFQVIRQIDLPLVGRAILVAAIFAFTISIGEFGATSLIARPEYPTVPLMIYRFLSQPGALNLGQGLALSTILMLVTAGGMLIIERFRIADVGEF